jgi:hypothetical protein
MVGRDGRLLETDRDSLIRCHPDFELIVILPGDQPSLPPMSSQMAFLAAETGRSFLAQNDISSAVKFFKSAGDFGRAVLLREVQQPKSDIHLRRARLCMRLAFNTKKISADEYAKSLVGKSDEYLIHECENTELTILEKEKVLLSLCLRNPTVAVRFVLRDVSLYRLLPRLIWENSGVFPALLRHLSESKIRTDARPGIADLLFGEGLVEEGIQIGYNFEMLRASLGPALAARKLWLLFLMGDYGTLFTTMLWFFEKYQTEKVGSIPLAVIFDMLDGIRKQTKRGRKRQSQMDKTLSGDQYPYFTAICVVGAFFFVQGYLNLFFEIKQILDPNNPRFFDGLPPRPGSSREWQFYKMLGREPWASDRVTPAPVASTVCMVGDEFIVETSLLPLQIGEFESPVIRPIYGLSIWLLKSGKHRVETTAFWHHVRDAQMYQGLMISIGKRDLLENIPKLLQSGKFTGVREIMTKLGEIYQTVMLDIRNRYPQFKLFVDKIRFMPKDGIPISQEQAFHAILRSFIPEDIPIIDLDLAHK